MKKFLPLFFLYLSLTTLGLQALVIAPVKIAADKVLYGSCPQEKCARQKQRLLEEYAKTKATDWTILGSLPKSYQQADHDYYICVRDSCGYLSKKQKN